MTLILLGSSALIIGAAAVVLIRLFARADRIEDNKRTGRSSDSQWYL